MGGLLERCTNLNAEQNARLYNTVGDGSGIGGGNGLCAGHVVLDAVDGINRLESQKANGADGGQ